MQDAETGAYGAHVGPLLAERVRSEGARSTAAVGITLAARPETVAGGEAGMQGRASFDARSRALQSYLQKSISFRV